MSAKCTDTKPCEQCGVSFAIGGRTGSKRTSRFCSHACQGLSRKKTKPCGQCGVSIKLARSFCSRACWEASRNREHNKVDFTCARCGSLFQRWPSQRQQRAAGGKVYCSGTCRAAGRVYATGKDHPQWKEDGGRTMRSDGYMYVTRKEHPKATKDGYVLEHRAVVEDSIGRLMESHETVHHINGDRADNRLENLQLRSGKHGKGVVHRCADCGSTNITSEKI